VLAKERKIREGKKREGGREGERVGEVWILFRERGRKRWWRGL
jgi:hypothetical protein